MNPTHTYTEITGSVSVDVVPEFLNDQSIPESEQFVFAYHVKVTNKGQEPIQLLRRHWVITDGHGQAQEVDGEGVIGQTPQIKQGETFEYSSFCPLPTPTGNMRGHYLMKTPGGHYFKATIPLFFLRDLSQLH